MDQSVIPFPGIARWVLRTPPQRPQSTSQIMGMVVHVELDQYQRANAAERPALGLERPRSAAGAELPVTYALVTEQKTTAVPPSAAVCG
jgi:hypothetical protein